MDKVYHLPFLSIPPLPYLSSSPRFHSAVPSPPRSGPLKSRADLGERCKLHQWDPQSPLDIFWVGETCLVVTFFLWEPKCWPVRFPGEGRCPLLPYMRAGATSSWVELRRYKPAFTCMRARAPLVYIDTRQTVWPLTWLSCRVVVVGDSRTRRECYRPEVGVGGKPYDDRRRRDNALPQELQQPSQSCVGLQKSRQTVAAVTREWYLPGSVTVYLVTTTYPHRTARKRPRRPDSPKSRLTHQIICTHSVVFRLFFAWA